MGLIVGQCKLCLESKPLSKCSHIIPEFMYKGLRSSRNKPFLLAHPKLLLEQKEDPVESRKGEFEGGILCLECERYLNNEFETYANNVIYGDGKMKSDELPIFSDHFHYDSDKNKMEFTLVKNIDYKRFKLFLLSILWRASISKRPMFSEVKLGPHNEVLRRLLRNKNIGDEHHYPVFFMSVKKTKINFLQTIYQPRKLVINGLTTYLFPIQGLIYQFVVCSKDHSIPKYFLQEGLKESGEMRLYHIPQAEALNFFRSYFHINNPMGLF